MSEAENTCICMLIVTDASRQPIFAATAYWFCEYSRSHLGIADATMKNADG
jgi:hypothetical protein